MRGMDDLTGHYEVWRLMTYQLWRMAGIIWVDKTEAPAWRKIVRFREQMGLTFDDVLLVPRRSPVKSRSDVSTATCLSRHIRLDIPIVSANMDTVTESEMATGDGRAGGIGIIHRFMTAEREAEEVRRVKRAESHIVESPYTISPQATLGKRPHE